MTVDDLREKLADMPGYLSVVGADGKPVLVDVESCIYGRKLVVDSVSADSLQRRWRCAEDTLRKIREALE